MLLLVACPSVCCHCSSSRPALLRLVLLLHTARQQHQQPVYATPATTPANANIQLIMRRVSWGCIVLAVLSHGVGKQSTNAYVNHWPAN
jgi:hypothetical protein